MSRTIVVRHYGPRAVSDADHTTSIWVDEEGKATDFISLMDDEEVDVLIELLQDARRQADGDEGQESRP